MTSEASVQVHFRLDAKSAEKFKRAAAKEGLSLNMYMRRLAHLGLSKAEKSTI
jgi:predicted HicB family RNase H-like nuclease